MLHIGSINRRHRYVIDGAIVTGVKNQLDLGITVREHLKWELHINKRVKSITHYFILYKRHSDTSVELMSQMYTIYVRPILDYSACVCSPYFQKETECLEKEQRCSTKLTGFMNYKTYEGHLAYFNLSSLQDRRIRRNLTEL